MITSSPALRNNPFTLDEPVTKTVMRDLKMVCVKISNVIIPRGRSVNALRDWDLWGPLILCLVMSTFLSFSTDDDEQKALRFALAFCLIWIGAAVVTVNSILLGGKTNFFQSVCVLGYCVFPLTVATVLLSIFRNFFSTIWFTLPLVSVCFAWSTFASISFMKALVPQNRSVLAVYPILLFYFVISWMIIIIL